MRWRPDVEIANNAFDDLQPVQAIIAALMSQQITGLACDMAQASGLSAGDAQRLIRRAMIAALAANILRQFGDEPIDVEAEIGRLRKALEHAMVHAEQPAGTA